MMMDPAAPCTCPVVDVKCIRRKKRKSIDFIKLQKVLGPSSLTWFDDLSEQIAKQRQQDQDAGTPGHLVLANPDTPCFQQQQVELLQAATPGMGSLTPLSAWALLSSQDCNTSTPAVDRSNINNRPGLLSPPAVESCLKTYKGISERLGLPTDDTNLSWTNSMATPCLHGDSQLLQESQEISTPAPKPKGFPRALFTPEQGQGDSDELVRELSVTMDEDILLGQIPDTPPVKQDLRKNMMKGLFLKSSEQSEVLQGQLQGLNQCGQNPGAFSEPVTALTPGRPSPVVLTDLSIPVTPQSGGRKLMKRRKKALVRSPLVADVETVETVEGNSDVSGQRRKENERVVDVDKNIQLRINMSRTSACLKGDVADICRGFVKERFPCSDTERERVYKSLPGMHGARFEDVSYSDTDEVQVTSPVLNRKVRKTELPSHNHSTRCSTESENTCETHAVVSHVLSDFMDSPCSLESRRHSAPNKGQKRKSVCPSLPDDENNGAVFCTPSPLGSQTTALQSILSSSKKRKVGSSCKKVRFAEKLCQREGEGPPTVAKKLEYVRCFETDSDNVSCVTSHDTDSRKESQTSVVEHDKTSLSGPDIHRVPSSHMKDVNIENQEGSDREQNLFESERIVLNVKEIKSFDFGSDSSKPFVSPADEHQTASADSSQPCVFPAEKPQTVSAVSSQPCVFPGEKPQLASAESAEISSEKSVFISEEKNSGPIAETNSDVEACVPYPHPSTPVCPHPSTPVCPHPSTPVCPQPPEELFSQISPSSLTEMCLVAVSDSSIEKTVSQHLPQASHIDRQSDIIGKSAADTHSMKGDVNISDSDQNVAETKALSADSKGEVKSKNECDRIPHTQNGESNTAHLSNDSKHSIEKSTVHADSPLKPKIGPNRDRTSNSGSDVSVIGAPKLPVHNLLSKKSKPKKFFYPTSSQIKAVSPKTVFNFAGREADFSSAKVVSDSSASVSSINAGNAGDVDSKSSDNVTHAVIDSSSASPVSASASCDKGVNDDENDADIMHRDESKVNMEYFSMGLMKFSEMFADNMDDDLTELNSQDHLGPDVQLDSAKVCLESKNQDSNCEAIKHISHSESDHTVNIGNIVDLTANLEEQCDSLEKERNVKLDWIPSSQDVDSMVEEVQEELFTDIEFSQVQLEKQHTKHSSLEEETRHMEAGEGISGTASNSSVRTSHVITVGKENTSTEAQDRDEIVVDKDMNVSDCEDHVFKMPDVPERKASVLSDSDTDTLLSDMDLSGTRESQRSGGNTSSTMVGDKPDVLSSGASDFETCVSEQETGGPAKDVPDSKSAVSSVSDSDTDEYVTSTEELKDVSPDGKAVITKSKICTRTRMSRRNSVLLCRSQMLSDSDSDVNPTGIRTSKKGRRGSSKCHPESLTVEPPVEVSDTNPHVVWLDLEYHGTKSSDLMSGESNESNTAKTGLGSPEYNSEYRAAQKISNLRQTEGSEKREVCMSDSDRIHFIPDCDGHSEDLTSSEKINRPVSVSDWSDLEPGEADEAEGEALFAASTKSCDSRNRNEGEESHQGAVVDEVLIRTEEGQQNKDGNLIVKDVNTNISDEFTSPDTVSRSDNLLPESKILLDNIKPVTFIQTVNDQDSGPSETSKDMKNPGEASEVTCENLIPDCLGFSTASGNKINIDSKSLQEASSLLETSKLEGSNISLERSDESHTGFSTASGKEVVLDAKSLQKHSLFDHECNVSHSGKTDLKVSSLRRKRTFIDVSEVSASCLADSVRSGCPSFSTASGKELSLRDDALKQAQMFMSSADNRVADTRQKARPELPVCRMQTTSNYTSFNGDTFSSSSGAVELESMLDDLLKSKKKNLEQSKHEQQEKLDFGSTLCMLNKGFQFSNKLGENNVEEKLRAPFDKNASKFKSSSLVGFSSVGKKSLEAVSNPGKTNPMLKPKGFRPFKKPRIIQKPKPVESDKEASTAISNGSSQDGVGADVGVSDAVKSGGETSGLRIGMFASLSKGLEPDLSDQHITDKFNPDMNQKLPLKFSKNMTEMSQTGNQIVVTDTSTTGNNETGHKVDRSSMNSDKLQEGNLGVISQHSRKKSDLNVVTSVGSESSQVCDSSDAKVSESGKVSLKNVKCGLDNPGTRSDAHLMLMDVLFEGDMSSQLEVGPANASGHADVTQDQQVQMEVDLAKDFNTGSADIDLEGVTVPKSLIVSESSVDESGNTGNFFQSASGKSVSVSVNALKYSKKLWNDTGDLKATNVRSGLDRTEVIDIVISQFESDHVVPSLDGSSAEEKTHTGPVSEVSSKGGEVCKDSSGSMLSLPETAVLGQLSLSYDPSGDFQTASGKSVNISDKAVRDARKMWKELASENGTEVESTVLFQTASGKGVSVSRKAVAEAKKILNDSDESTPVVPSPGSFGSTSGTDVTLLADTDAMSEKMLESVSSAAQSISTESVTHSKNLWNDGIQHKSVDAESSLFHAASGSSVSILAKAIAQGKKLWTDENEKVTSSCTSMFQKASGNSVNVSSKALAHGKKLWTDENEQTSKFSTSLFQTASGDSVNVSSKALAHGKKLWTDENEQTSKFSTRSLFQTASGDSVNVSSKALAHGKKLWTDENEQTSKFSTTSLFQTASGDSVNVSSKALAHGKKLWTDENEQTSKFSTTSLFQKASGDSVNVSSKALAHGKKLWTDENEQTSKSSTSSHFQTAAGSSVSVSSKTLALGSNLFRATEEESSVIKSCDLKLRCMETMVGGEGNMAVCPQIDPSVTRQMERDCRSLDQDNQGNNLRNPLLSAPEAVFLDRGGRDGRRFHPLRSTSQRPKCRSEEYMLEGVTEKSGLSMQQGTSSNFKTPYKNTAFVTPIRRTDTQQKANQSDCKTPVFHPRASLRTNQNLNRNSPPSQNTPKAALNRINSNSGRCVSQGQLETVLTGSSPCSLSNRMSCRANPTREERSTTSSINSVEVGSELAREQNIGSVCDPNKGVSDEDLVKETSMTKPLVNSLQTEKEYNVAKFKCQLEEARQKQGEVIQRKRTQKISPCCGRLLSEKLSGRQKIQYGDLVETAVSDEQLCMMGVRQETCLISSDITDEFRFCLSHFYPQLTRSVLVGDGAELIPDNSGFAGKEEFCSSFLTLDGVDPKLTSDLWVYNHYRWIVWKLAAYEVTMPKHFGGRCLTPNNVMLQLKYRYDREVDRCQRSAIKKIVERDDAACKRLVLCVARIQNSSDQTVETSVGSGKVLELTDGWYSVRANINVGLSELVERKKIQVGHKICVSGAELVGSQDACPPLEIPDTLRLKICMNSTRPAPWDSKLGYQRDPRPLCIPISSLHAEGGVVGCIDVVVSRVYPLMYMEKVAEGGSVFRTEEAEERVQRQFDQQKQGKMEKLYTELQSKLEQNQGTNRRKSRKRWTQCEVEELQTGQEIYDAVEGSLAPEELHCWLSSYQQHQMEDYQRRLQEEKHQQLQDKFNKAWEEAYQDSATRKVTPVLKLRLAGCAKKDIDAKTSTVVTIWRPNAEWLGLQEGKRYKIFGLTATPARTRLESHSVNLTANRQTRLQHLPVDENYLDLIHEPREVWCVRDLRVRSPAYKEFDFVGIVVSHLTDSTKNCDTVIVTDVEGDTLTIRFWGRMQYFGIQDQLAEGKTFVGTNLVLRSVQGIVMAEACHEVTRFSSSTTYPDHRKFLGRLTSMTKTEKMNLIEAAKSVVSPQMNRSLAQPTHLTTTPEKFFSDLPSECLQRLFSPMEEIPTTKGDSTVAKGNNPVTPDSVTRKRRAVLRERSSKLMAYGSPKPLSPLPIQVSPAVSKAFKSPSSLTTNNKDSIS